MSRAQARTLGADRWVLARRVAAGGWELPSPRVLRRVGAPPTDRQLLMVAVLDAGSGAVASHGSAAALWRLPGFTLVCPEVSRQRGTNGSVSTAASVHRPRSLPPHHTATVDGIPCTTLGRTLFDLAGSGVRPRRMERLVDDVVTRSPAVLARLHELLDELGTRGRSGVAVMREILDARPAGTRVAASGLEARFEQVLSDAGERGLERQVDVGGHSWVGRVDYLDRELGLIFEIDSATHHSSPLDLRRDAERDVAMRLAGWTGVVRIPAEALWSRPDEVVQTVRRARRLPSESVA